MGVDRVVILLIADIPAIVESVQTILQPNYTLAVLNEGQDGLEMVKQQPPDLILLDMALHSANADCLFERLRADHETQDIPVLCITNSERDIPPGWVEAGCVDCITRPIYPILLLARIQTYLHLNHFRDVDSPNTTTDPLTGVYNRKYLEGLLQREWRRSLRFQTPQSLIVLEVDYFDDFQKGCGQPVAEDCLRQIARLLVKQAQREIDCVARFDESVFAILLPETDTSGALEVARHIEDALRALNLPHPCSPVADCITLSAGLTTMRPKPKQKPAQLFHQAFARLSEAKKAGHHQIKFD